MAPLGPCCICNCSPKCIRSSPVLPHSHFLTPTYTLNPKSSGLHWPYFQLPTDRHASRMSHEAFKPNVFWVQQLLTWHPSPPFQYSPDHWPLSSLLFIIVSLFPKSLGSIRFSWGKAAFTWVKEHWAHHQNSWFWITTLPFTVWWQLLWPSTT